MAKYVNGALVDARQHHQYGCDACEKRGPVAGTDAHAWCLASVTVGLNVVGEGMSEHGMTFRTLCSECANKFFNERRELRRPDAT